MDRSTSQTQPRHGHRPRRRYIVRRADGEPINVTRYIGHIFVCADGCCCGITERGYEPVPRDLFHSEWERRRLRNKVHLTIGGCLGPCALANVVMLSFAGHAIWFHSFHTRERVLALYDYIESMLRAGRYLMAPESLQAVAFAGYSWDSAAIDSVDDGEFVRQTAVDKSVSTDGRIEDA